MSQACSRTYMHILGGYDGVMHMKFENKFLHKDRRIHTRTQMGKQPKLCGPTGVDVYNTDVLVKYLYTLYSRQNPCFISQGDFGVLGDRCSPRRFWKL